MTLACLAALRGSRCAALVALALLSTACSEPPIDREIIHHYTRQINALHDDVFRAKAKLREVCGEWSIGFATATIVNDEADEKRLALTKANPELARRCRAMYGVRTR